MLFSHNRRKQKSLLVYKGKIPKVRPASLPCKFLIDSGCEEIVDAKQLADRLKLQREKTSLEADLWDVKLEAMQQCTKNLFIQVGKATITLQPYIVHRIVCEIILGKSCLSESNLKVDYRSNTMKLCITDRFISLDAKCSESENSIQEHTITGKQLARMTRKRHCRASQILARPLQGENSYKNEHPKEREKLLKYGSHVFLEDLPS